MIFFDNILMDAYLVGIQTWRKISVLDSLHVHIPHFDIPTEMKVLRDSLAAYKNLACVELVNPVSNKLTHFMIYNAGFEIKRVINCGRHIDELHVALIGKKCHRFLRIKSTRVNYTPCKSLAKLAEIANCEAVDVYVDRIRCREFMQKTERKLAKIKEYIKYAPGGPVMAEALSDFQEKADFTG